MGVDLSIDDCLQIAARIWTDWQFSSVVMDVVKCEQIAHILKEVADNQRTGGNK